MHNGIIENFRELKAELTAKGHKFESETDSEVAAHLVTQLMSEGLAPDEAAKHAVARLTGAYSIAMIFKDHEGLLVGARSGAPLAVGYADTRSLYRLRRFCAGAFHQPRRLSGRRRCGGDQGRRRSRSSTPKAAPPIARSRSPPPSPRWWTRPATPISWPRKSMSSRKWWAIPWRITSIPPARCAPPGQGPARCAGQGLAPDHFGLRHRLLRRHGGQILVREAGAHGGGNRCGVGTALSRSGLSRKWRGAVRVPVGRDRRHAGGAARRQGQGPDHHRGGQCGRIQHRARSRYRAAHLCRAGNRRRLHQGLHLPAGGAGLVSPSRRARRADHLSKSGGKAALRLAAGNAAPYRRIPEAGSRRSSRWARKSPRRATFFIWAAAPAIRWRWKAR